jgi:hypothetical protein
MSDSFGDLVKKGRDTSRSVREGANAVKDLSNDVNRAKNELKDTKDVLAGLGSSIDSLPQSGGIATANARAARDAGYLNDSSFKTIPAVGTAEYNKLVNKQKDSSPAVPETKPLPRPVPVSPTASRPTQSSSHHRVPEFSSPQSEVERALLNATQPLHNLAGTRETINLGPYSGLYLNKHEADQWRGPVPIESYPINEDQHPEVIHKRIDKVHYEQVCATRWLNPGPAPRSG